jgi:hypothetical protein
MDGKCHAFFTLPIRAYLRETGEGNRSTREAQKMVIAERAVSLGMTIVIKDMRQKTAEGYQRKVDQMNARARAA